MKNKKISSAFLLATLFLGASSGFAFHCQPQNLDCVKKQLIQYHDDGRYERGIAMMDSQALFFLKDRLAHANPNEKLAVVLDIDETSLSNYRDMVEMNFGGTKQQMADAAAKGTDAVIKPTLELFNYAKANHIAVFFITGRPESMREVTERNLTNMGYHNWDGLILKPDEYHAKSIIPFKSSSRRALSKNGYQIVVNIGDQASDLAGGYSERAYKLPNPYYFLP